MFVTSGEVEIFYRTLGSGPDVVLLHAFPVDHEMWLPLAQRLAQQYRVILLDLRGHGASGVAVSAVTMQQHAYDVWRVCEACGARQAIFGGVSIGGYILFELWRQAADRVRALILSDTRAQADTEPSRAARLQSAEDVEKHGPRAFLDGMVPKLLGPSSIAERPDVVARVRHMMDKMTAQGIVAVQRGMAARPDSRATLATVTVPTLVLVGADDTVTTIADAEAIRQGIAGSSSAVLPLAGHLAVLEQPDAAAEVVGKFLDSLKLTV
jgi:pimeloyl-ACP methyl ester carboxylesterase